MSKKSKIIWGVLILLIIIIIYYVITAPRHSLCKEAKPFEYAKRMIEQDLKEEYGKVELLCINKYGKSFHYEIINRKGDMITCRYDCGINQKLIFKENYTIIKPETDIVSFYLTFNFKDDSKPYLVENQK